MRKLLLITFALIISLASYCQTIGYRKDSDESLNIKTNYIKHPGYMGIALHYLLNKITKEEQWKLGIILYSRDIKLSIDLGARLLIRTFDDKIIELKQNKDNIEQDFEYPIPGNIEITDFLAYPYYDISGDDLQIIMNGGIKKIKFETTKGMRSIECKEDVFGQDIKSEYDLILGKSDFSADF